MQSNYWLRHSWELITARKVSFIQGYRSWCVEQPPVKATHARVYGQHKYDLMLFLLLLLFYLFKEDIIGWIRKGGRSGKGGESGHIWSIHLVGNSQKTDQKVGESKTKNNFKYWKNFTFKTCFSHLKVFSTLNKFVCVCNHLYKQERSLPTCKIQDRVMTVPVKWECRGRQFQLRKHRSKEPAWRKGSGPQLEIHISNCSLKIKHNELSCYKESISLIIHLENSIHLSLLVRIYWHIKLPRIPTLTM